MRPHKVSHKVSISQCGGVKKASPVNLRSAILDAERFRVLDSFIVGIIAFLDDVAEVISYDARVILYANLHAKSHHDNTIYI